MLQEVLRVTEDSQVEDFPTQNENQRTKIKRENKNTKKTRLWIF